MLKTNKAINGSERGNALFLILIAVALFAALSYAITQSGRGGGNVSTETAMIAAGQVTQYPAGLRTTITRMIITGVTATALSMETVLADAPCVSATTYANCLFGPNGGSAVVEAAPTAASSNAWVYKDLTQVRLGVAAPGLLYVLGVGTDADGATSGADAIAALTAIPLVVCQQIEKGLGYSTTLDSTLSTVSWSSALVNETVAGAANTVKLTTNGRAFNCVTNGGTNYDYYHVLIEQ